MTVHVLDKRGRNGCALLVGDAFADCNHAALVFRIDGLHVRDEVLECERPFRQIDQMGTVIGINARECGGSGQETGMAPHDDIDFNARQSPVVEVVSHERLRDEFCGAAEPGSVIVFAEIIVNRLADVEAPHDIAFLLRFFVNDMRRLSAVVATDVKEIADIVFLEDLKNLDAIFRGRLFANGAQCRGGGAGDQLEVGFGFLPEIAEVLFKNPFEAVSRTVDFLDRRLLLGFEDRANEALIDYNGGTATLGDQHIAD